MKDIFSAGRFEAKCYLGVENGRSTVIIERHRNGGGEDVSGITVDYDDLPDLLHVLTRAIQAHEETKPRTTT